jgi:hypothetical protein
MLMSRRDGLAAVVVLTVLAAPAAAQVNLEWKFKEGDKFYLQTDSTLNQTLTTGGAEFKQQIDHTVVVSFTVKKKSTDSVVLEQKIEEYRVKSSGPGTADLKPPEALKGATFTVTLNAKWEITKFEGYAAFIKKLAGDDPAVEKVIGSVLPEDSFKSSAEEAFGFLPNKPVKKGDRWQRTLVYPLGPWGTLTATNDYTYEGKHNEKVNGKDVERIAAAMTTKFKPPTAGSGALGIQVIENDLQTKEAKQTIFFDAAAGRLVKSETKLRVEGKLAYSAAGRPVETEVKQEQTITAQAFDKNPLAK